MAIISTFLRDVVVGLAFLCLVSGAPIERSQNSTSILTIRSERTGYQSVGYFADWHTYAPHSYTADKLPGNDLTHILFSFAMIKPNGTVFLKDTFGDYDMGKDWNAQGKNVYGAVEDLFKLKKKNRNAKVLLSIGGYDASKGPEFRMLASTQGGRQAFAASSVTLLKDLGLDGIDIDWEFPANDLEAENYVHLLAELRSALDTYSTEHANGHHFEITVACPAGSVFQTLHLAQMDRFLDAWHLMAYDYAGSWSKKSGHHSNLYASTDNPASTEWATDNAITGYMAAGIPAHKLVLGVGFYGQAFKDTDGIGKFSGGGSGTPDYKELPKHGAVVYHDAIAGAAFSYDPVTRELVSFDTPLEMQLKATYIKEKGLGGAMYWEMSQDKTGKESLFNAMVDVLGRGDLKQGQNWLEYPESQYDNIKAGMPE